MKYVKSSFGEIPVLNIKEFINKSVEKQMTRGRYYEYSYRTQADLNLFAHNADEMAIDSSYVRRYVELSEQNEHRLMYGLLNTVERHTTIRHTTVHDFFEYIITRAAYDFQNAVLVRISPRTWACIPHDNIKMIVNEQGHRALVSYAPVSLYQMDITIDMFNKKYPTSLTNQQGENLINLLRSVGKAE